MTLIRQGDGNEITGAAMVLSSDGFLMTVESALGKRPVVVLPNGQAVSPIRVATDSITSLTLLKVAAIDLETAPFETIQPPPQGRVFAVGFDQPSASFGQVAGRVDLSTTATPASGSPLIRTDIGFAQGLAGGALAGDGGQVIGIIVPARSPTGGNVVAAIPAGYVADWLASWRVQNQNVVSDSPNWPELHAGTGVTLRYPSGWSVSGARPDGRFFHADIVPNDPDVPARLSISVEQSNFTGVPLAFARQQFGDDANATLWGAVEFGEIPGVRVLINQEGARVDVVYLFAHDLRIGVSLTAGYAVTDTGEQERRVTALYETVLRSISLVPATPTN